MSSFKMRRMEIRSRGFLHIAPTQVRVGSQLILLLHPPGPSARINAACINTNRIDLPLVFISTHSAIVCLDLSGSAPDSQ